MDVKVNVDVVSKEDIEIPIIRTLYKVEFKPHQATKYETFETEEFEMVKSWLNTLSKAMVLIKDRIIHLYLPETDSTLFKVEVTNTTDNKLFLDKAHNDEAIFFQAILSINDVLYVALGETTAKGYWLSLPELIGDEAIA